MYDFVMTMDGYLEASQDERLRTLNHVAKSFEHAIGGIVSGVTTAAEELRNTADALTQSAEETNQAIHGRRAGLARGGDECSKLSPARRIISSHAIGEVSARVPRIEPGRGPRRRSGR